MYTLYTVQNKKPIFPAVLFQANLVMELYFNTRLQAASYTTQILTNNNVQTRHWLSMFLDLNPVTLRMRWTDMFEAG